jgi:hypothetical protein
MKDAAAGLDFARLASNNVALIILLPVPLWSLQKFAASVPALAPHLACDPAGAVFKALNCNFSFATKKLRPDSIHAHTSVLGATWSGLVEGMATGMQGDPRQMGGALIVKEGKVIWQHKDQYNADQVPIPVLLAACQAGVEGAYKHPGAE